MDVNPAPIRVPPDVDAAMRSYLESYLHPFLYQLWQRTGGGFDQIEENAAKPFQRPVKPEEGESPGAPLPPRESPPEARIDVIGIAAARKAAEALAGSAPIGSIVVWSGAIADIPEGWVECDGTNGTPDLRERIVVGAKVSVLPVGTTSGSITDVTTGPSATVEVDNTLAGSTVFVGDSTHTHTADVLPPFHALAYIQRIF